VPELIALERRLARLERTGNVVSVVVGAAVAVVFLVVWFLWTGWVYARASLVPFLIGSVIAKLVFSFLEARVAIRIRQLKGLDPAALPEARVVRRDEPEPEPEPEPLPRLAEPARAPEPAPPPSDRPRFLG